MDDITAEEWFKWTKRVIDLENKELNNGDVKYLELVKRVEELEKARQVQISINRQFQADVATLQAVVTKPTDKDIPLKEEGWWSKIFK